MTGDVTARVRVDLGDRSYDIHVGSGMLERGAALAAPLLAEKRIFVVTDTTVAALHAARLEQGFAAAGIAVHRLTLPPGEATKSWDELGRLLDRLLDFRPERRSVLLALGGGVIGDITGLAASLLLRGVDFIQAPTTLLAQVDSAVGGKTAVDARQGKNLIGSFHQPRLVLCDLEALATLPARERVAGYAEIVKYGLLGDPGFFAWCETAAETLLAGDAPALAHAVAESCRAKARIVGADEREAGQRALLNLGHTFAHAFETAAGYGDALLHPSGKFMWPLALITGQTDQVKGVARDVVCLSPRHSLDPRAEGNVVHYAHPGEEPRLLEHHPAIGCGTCDGDSVDKDAALTWVCKACYEIEQGALAATGWADDGDELPGLDVQIDSGKNEGIRVVAKPLTDALETH